MQFFTRTQVLIWLLLFLVSGAAQAGVVDDAEEVLEAVRGEKVVTGRVRDDGSSSSSNWSSQSSVTSPSHYGQGESRSASKKTLERPKANSKTPVSDSTEEKDSKSRRNGPKVDGKSQMMNFAALFFLIALIGAAVGYSNKSGEDS